MISNIKIQILWRIKSFIVVFLVLNLQILALPDSKSRKENLSDYLNRASAYEFSGQVSIAERRRIQDLERWHTTKHCCGRSNGN